MHGEGDIASGVRLAELVASLSYATDLGRGLPMEHSIRRARLSLRLADLIGAGEDDRIAVYYTGLLDGVYCHADADEQALWFGDDIAVKTAAYEADTESLRGTLIMLRQLGSGEAGVARLRRIAAFPLRGWAQVRARLDTHSALQADFAQRIGLPESTCDALRHSYERWDGRGPNGIEADRIPLPARIVCLADVTEVHHHRGGLEAACEVARRRSGGELDPDLAATFRAHASELLADLDAATGWRDVIAAEPGLDRVVGEAELDRVLRAMGDLVDLKSPYFAGHSRGVASLAAEAARLAGMPPADQALLRRAGYVHDLGRLGVSNAIWEKRGPLAPSPSRDRSGRRCRPRARRPSCGRRCARAASTATRSRPSSPPPATARRSAGSGPAASPPARSRCWRCSPAASRTRRSRGSSSSTRRPSPATSSTSTPSSASPPAPAPPTSPPNTTSSAASRPARAGTAARNRRSGKRPMPARRGATTVAA